jgi:hypothetical protein
MSLKDKANQNQSSTKENDTSSTNTDNNKLKSARKVVTKQSYLRKFRFLYQDASLRPQHIDLLKHGRLENVLRYADFLGKLLQSGSYSQLYRAMSYFIQDVLEVNSAAIFEKSEQTYHLKYSDGFMLEKDFQLNLSMNLIAYVTTEDNVYSRHMLLQNSTEKSFIEAHNINFIIPIFAGKDCELLIFIGKQKDEKPIPLNDIILLRIIGLSLGKFLPFLKGNLKQSHMHQKNRSVENLLTQFNDFLISETRDLKSQKDLLSGVFFEDFNLPTFLILLANEDGSEVSHLAWNVHDNDIEFFKHHLPAMIDAHNNDKSGVLQRLLSGINAVEADFQAPPALQAFLFFQNQEDFKYFIFGETFQHLSAFEQNLLHNYLFLCLDHFTLTVLKKNLTKQEDLENPARHLNAFAIECEEYITQNNAQYSMVTIEFTNLKRIIQMEESLTTKQLLDLLYQFLKESFPESRLISRLGIDRFFIFILNSQSIMLNQSLNRLEELIENEFPHSGARPLYKKEIYNRPENSRSEIFQNFP